MSYQLAIIMSLALPGIIALVKNYTPIGNILSAYNVLLACEPAPDDSIWTSCKRHINVLRNGINGIMSYTQQSILEKLFGPARKIKPGLLAVSYYHEGKWYQALVEHKHSPTRVRSVWHHTSNITEKIKPLLGPDEKCWYKRLTPRDLGYDDFLVFELLDYRGLTAFRIHADEDIGFCLASKL